MNLGLDLDDTITSAPKQLAALAKSVKMNGGMVYILHGARGSLTDDQERLLAQTKLANAGFGGANDEGRLYDAIDLAPKPYAKTKAKLAQKRKLDLFLDNRGKNVRRVSKAGIPSGHFHAPPQ